MKNDFDDDRHAKGGAAGGLLLFLGFVATGAGAAFAASPHFSWQVQKIARQVHAYGVGNDVLIVGGLLLFGLGLVARAVAGNAKLSRAPQPQNDNSDVLRAVDGLVREVGDVRTSVAQVAGDLLAVSEAQRVFHAQAQQARDEQQPDSQDALFRLAASLDKLNAHIDERFHGIDVQFRSRFDTVANAIQETRSVLEAKLQELPAHAAPAAPPAAPVQPLASAGATPEPAPAPEAPLPVDPVAEELDETGQPRMDFFETMEKLDEIARHGTTATPPQAAPQQPAAPEQAPPPAPGQHLELQKPALPQQQHEPETLDAFLPDDPTYPR